MARTLTRGRLSRMPFAELYLRCALDEREVASEQDDARAAVRLWALLATGKLTREEVRQAAGGGPGPIVPVITPSPAATDAALAMAELPADRVRDELAPRWARLRSGTLPVGAAGRAAVTTLLRYRQRPVAWGWLAGLAAGWLLGVRALAGCPTTPAPA
jgi:hypothetical protein